MPRQTIYEKEDWANKLDLIKGWARDGLTNNQIAHNMGISKDTFYQYQKKYSDFKEALKTGKEVSDYEVENALYKNATGFHYIEEQVTNSGNVVEVRKYSKPQTTAMIYWLKNRKPANWRDKPKVNKENRHQTKPLHDMLETLRDDNNDRD